ncbi:MAG: twin-arginine translocation pathway signal, partial [Planctomycetota bacterium]|nr:twin-arginine translocation pathway signal [Planctomycetota bacterium]
MEDWRIINGAAECQTTGGFRNIQLLTHQLQGKPGNFTLSVDVQQVEVRKIDAGCGFQLGVKSDLNEYRSNCFARNGIRAGVIGQVAVLGKRRLPLDGMNLKQGVRIELKGQSVQQGFKLVLTVISSAGEILGQLENRFPLKSVIGNICLVNNYDSSLKKGQGARYRFKNWIAEGNALSENAENQFGPLLWTMYTLSDSRSDEGFVMKLT